MRQLFWKTTVRHWTARRAVVACIALHAVAVGCRRSPTGIDPASFPQSPAEAQFITDDLRRFWAAYDAGGRDGNTGVFQSMYLDSATPGLRNFMASRAVTASAITGVVTTYRQYFAALRPISRAITPTDSVFLAVRSGYVRIKSLYPAAFFPPVTLLVGRFSTGGTTGNAGLLLGMEFYGVDANAPIGELNAFARSNQFSLRRDFPALVAHEHVHMMQVAAGAQGSRSGQSLLARSLIEGGADFVGELTSGRASYIIKYADWQSRELEFWTAFQQEMNKSDISHWLYNQQSETRPNWPGDLGYFVGYRIAQAYYLQAADKSAAVRDLIAQRDPTQLLARSGYAGQGPMISIPTSP